MPIILEGAWAFIKPIVTNKYFLMALAAAAVLWYSHHLGYVSGKAECEASHQHAVVKETTRIKKGDAKATAKSNARTADDKQKDKDNGKHVQYIYLHAPSMPRAAAQCITPDVADSLRDIH